MYYILFYKTIDNYVEKRAPFKEEHLSVAQQAYQNALAAEATTRANADTALTSSISNEATRAAAAVR